MFTQLFLPFVKINVDALSELSKILLLAHLFFFLVDGDCLPFKQVNLFSFCLFNQIKTSFFSPTKYIKFSNYNDLFGSIEILLSLSELFLLNQSDKKQDVPLDDANGTSLLVSWIKSSNEHIAGRQDSSRGQGK